MSDKVRKRFYKVKYTVVPCLGYLDSHSEKLGERILHRVVTSTWDTPLQLLKRGDTIEGMDIVWAPSEGALMGRFRTQDGVLVCIPYVELDKFLEVSLDG